MSAWLLLLFSLLCCYYSLCIAADDQTEELDLYTINSAGVILHKQRSGPIEERPVGDDFPHTMPARFIRQAYGIDAPNSIGGKHIMEKQSASCTSESDGGEANLDVDFGSAILARAKQMFAERECQDELDFFLKKGVSNPEAGPRRMHWAALEILPNQSLALHSHPNIEFAYIVDGVMHEHRIVDHSIEKKKAYTPESIEVDGQKHLRYHGPDLSHIDASMNGTFKHNAYSAGDMFINTIGDVHQSYTMDEGVKLFVMWGDGNADIPEHGLPQNSADFLNAQSAKAWE